MEIEFCTLNGDLILESLSKKLAENKSQIFLHSGLLIQDETGQEYFVVKVTLFFGFDTEGKKSATMIAKCVKM